MPKSSWFCVNSHPKQERLVAQQLASHNFEVFFPVFEAHKPNRHIVTLPLFANYLFVHLSDPLNWLRARHIEGVKSVLTYQPSASEYAVPLTVNSDIIEGLRGQSEIISNAHVIKPATRVRIVRGPFKDLEGVCLSTVDAQKRVLLLLSIFHRETQAHFYVADLALVFNHGGQV